MERNDDGLPGAGMGGSTGGSAGSTGGSTGGFGNSGNVSGTSGYGTVGGALGSNATGSGLGASENVGNIGTTTEAGMGGTSGATGGAGFTERARDLAGTAGERLADVGGTVRDRAGAAKSSLADMLESGAERLGARGTGATGGDGSLALSDSNGMNDRLASGMRSAANVLRDTDWDGVRAGVERQVRENPARTLLVAVGVGYLLGKALRR